MKHHKIFVSMLAVGLLGAWLVPSVLAGPTRGGGGLTGVTTGATVTDIRREQALFEWCDKYMAKTILPKLQELLKAYDKQAACWRDARGFGLRGHTVGRGILDRTSKCAKIDEAVRRLQAEGMALLETWRARGCGEIKPKKK